MRPRAGIRYSRRVRPGPDGRMRAFAVVINGALGGRADIDAAIDLFVERIGASPTKDGAAPSTEPPIVRDARPGGEPSRDEEPVLHDAPDEIEPLTSPAPE